MAAVQAPPSSPDAPADAAGAVSDVFDVRQRRALEKLIDEYGVDREKNTHKNGGEDDGADGVQIANWQVEYARRHMRALAHLVLYTDDIVQQRAACDDNGDDEDDDTDASAVRDRVALATELHAVAVECFARLVSNMRPAEAERDLGIVPGFDEERRKQLALEAVAIEEY